MGNIPSVDISPPPNFNYFSIQFGDADKLRFIAASDAIINATRAVLVATHWTIQDIHESRGFYEFKLKGTPWMPSLAVDISVKNFLCKLIQKYYSIGWHLKTSSDLRLRGDDSSAVIFERAEPVLSTVICLSLNGADTLRVIAPIEIIPELKAIIMTHWPSGMQREQIADKCYEFKLNGTPWDTCENSVESFHTMVLMNAIFSVLYQNGYVFAAPIDSDNRHDDLSSLYFKYDMTENRNAETGRFFALSLNRTDTIRLINAPNEIIEIVKASFAEIWTKGVQSEKEQSGGYEFKLFGNPWNSYAAESVEACRLLSDLFAILNRHGWNLNGTCTLTKSLSDKSSFFFRYSEPVVPVKMLSLSLNDEDKIRLIGKYERILPLVRDSIMKSWPSGIENEMLYYNSWQFKLKGTPFLQHGANNIYACYMLLMILNSLESLGIRLISSADISGKHVLKIRKSGNIAHDKSYTTDLDTWYFAENS